MSGGEEVPVFGTDAACDALRKLWLGVANRAEESANFAETPLEILHWACLADAAFWQATGEGDCQSINRLAADFKGASA